MKYNGHLLNAITKPQVFDPPKEMLVWDNDYDKPEKEMVWCIAPPAIYKVFPVLGTKGSYKNCAEIPKPKRATYLQLAEYLAKGNGMWKIRNTTTILSHFPLSEESLDEEVRDHVVIRPFGTGTKEWIEPTLENMGME